MNFNLEFADPVVWNDEVDYAINDVVFNDGEAYTAIDYVPIGTPLTDSTKWRRSGKYVRTADIADDAVTNGKLADGAITVEKLGNDIFDLIESDINESKQAVDKANAVYTTSDKIQVLDYSNYLVDEVNACFGKNQYLSSSAPAYTEGQLLGVEREDGSIIEPLPMPNNASTIPSIEAFINAVSFMNHDIAYGRENGLFNDDTITAQQMVCSDFVFAYLIGLSYDCSKFSIADNVTNAARASTSFKTHTSMLSPVARKSLITRELAAYFAYCGNLQQMKNDLSNVSPGDVIFFSPIGDAGQDGSIKESGFYLGIEHCAIVINVDTINNHLLLAQTGVEKYTNQWCFQTSNGNYSTTNSVGLFDTLISEENYTCYIAKPCFPQSSKEPYIEFFDEVNYTIQTATSVLISFNSTKLDGKTIKKNSYFEMMLEGDFNKYSPTTSNGYFRILVTNDQPSGAFRYARCYIEGVKQVPNRIKVCGIVNDDIGDSSNIILQLKISSSVADGNSTPIKISSKFYI